MSETIAIIYGSGEGQTEKIAGHIAKKLGRTGFEVDSYNGKKLPKGFDLKPYDGVIVGASVHAGGYPKPIARLVRDHREEMKKKPSAFFSVSLTASDEGETAQEEIQELIDQFLDSLQWQPQMAKSFAGAIPFSKYGFLKRTIMKFILRGRGKVVDTSKDYEYTDWESVDDFAEAFGQMVEESSRPQKRPRP